MRTPEQQARFDTFVARTEVPIAILALLIAPSIMLENHSQTALIRETAWIVNWVVWLAFCAFYAAKIALAPDRARFLTTSWVDALMVAAAVPLQIPLSLQGSLLARVVGVLRFMRGATVAALGLRITSHILKRDRFHYVALTTAVVVSLGALGIFTFEHGQNPRIETFGDAVWWAVVTATTVGYGDVSPVTTEGRTIAVSLMLLGIGFVGIFTATISNFFFDQGRVNVEERLARIEQKLDALHRDRVERERISPPPARRAR
jgi:voltage-gated potassium channel